MKKLITFIALTFLVNVAYAQENLDSLHQVISSELDQKVTSLQVELNSATSALNTSVSKQADDLQKIKRETSSVVSDSLSVFKREIKTQIKNELAALNEAIRKERGRVSNLNDSIDALKSQLSGGLTVIDSHVSDLDTDLNKASAELKGVKEVGEQSQRDLHEYLSYALGAICIILLLIILVYWLSHKRHTTGKSDLADAKSHLQEQISTANAEFAEKLLEAISALPKPDAGVSVGAAPSDNQSLILDFAQQIASMENNIWHLPDDDKVRKRIERATKKMRDTFKSLGYEMPQLMGTEVSDNQIIEIKNRAEDPSLPEGKVIICRVAKPLVLFEGKMISGQRPIVDVKENTEE
jgi:DNA repair exonuclease SbcCD ATPase subunit